MKAPFEKLSPKALLNDAGPLPGQNGGFSRAFARLPAKASNPESSHGREWHGQETGHSRLLYRVELRDGRGAYVYVLFEHKSYPEALVAFQMLRYLVRIWEQDLQQQRGLRPIVPVVVYHGPASWRVGLDFWSLFDGPEEFKPYVPDYVYWLCDLSRYSEEELKGAVVLRMTLLTLKHILHDDLGEHLAGILTLGAELSRKETGLEYLETLLRYLAQATDKIGEEELREAVEAALPEGGRVMATIAETWMERGVQQGIRQGVQQGQQLGIREGLLSGIEVALEIRFGSEGLKLLPEIYQIQDVALLVGCRTPLQNTTTICMGKANEIDAGRYKCMGCHCRWRGP